MISISGTRQRGKEFFKNCPARSDETQAKAFELLVGCELKFGGNITELTPTKIVVVTRVLGCLDTTVFEGDESEMLPLVEITALYIRADMELHDEILAQVSDKCAQISGGNTLLFTASSGMVLGASRLKTALALQLGLEGELLQRIIEMNCNDVASIAALHLEDPSVPMRDLIDLAA